MKYTETILLVDDESLVRSALAGMLSARGYRCIVAANAIDAMQIIEADLFRLDLLVTDIKMPGALDGLDLANKVRELQLDVAILLITAYAESPTMKEAALRGYRVLEKPFRQNQFEAAVADELSRRGGDQGKTGGERDAAVVSLREARRKGRG